MRGFVFSDVGSNEAKVRALHERLVKSCSTAQTAFRQIYDEAIFARWMDAIDNFNQTPYSRDSKQQNLQTVT